ncbi:hypothetical protein ABID16_000516 [Rhizobium aquaticum]|uniref:DUF4352 domain-containing protein n=1 Tax=Rhizobium aquaticum TaxID=1549636 RepID=A0ABV2IUX1_9HYPH
MSWRHLFFSAVCCLFLVAFTSRGAISASESQSGIVLEIPFPPFSRASSAEIVGHAPCRENEDNRSSDLCAQWKAADAAKASVDWARRSYFVSIGGTLIGFLTLVAAAAAAVFAKKAADETKRSADAAHDSVAETRRIGEAQVRAYLALDPQAFGSPASAYTKHVIDVKIRNTGQTPAKNITIQMNVFVLSKVYELGTDHTIEINYGNVPHSDIHVGGNSEQITHILVGPFPEQERKLIADYDTHRLFLIGKVEYVDVFNCRHITNLMATYEKTGKFVPQKIRVISGPNAGSKVDHPTERDEQWDWKFTPSCNAST